jgi:FMN phosphatase YigB (HAD superfamily)
MSDLIIEIRKIIQKNEIKTVSLDVFDTLVFRRTSCPTDIFSQAFTNYSQLQELGISAQEYKELRVHAEKMAKREVLNGEANLQEIFDSLPFSSNICADLQQAELDSEKTLSFVYQPMLELIEALQYQGIVVMLISDMYLSSQQIREYFFSGYPILKALPLHVSSEHRVNKSSGLLFDYLKKRLNIDPLTWLHLGDNQISDFTVPKQKCIQAKWLNTALLSAHIFHLESLLSPEVQTFNAVRFITSSHFIPENENEAVAFNIGASIWGPILFAFADWVIDQTIKVKSSCILCLMREAEVFSPIIELRLKQREIEHILVRKLYASRKSTFWPAIDIQDAQWFENLINISIQRRGYTVDDFYRDFLLEHDLVHNQYKDKLTRDTDGLYSLGQNLRQQLTSNARKNIGAVEAYIKQQKALFIRYYNNQIGQVLNKCTVLDLGGGGTIQYQIEAIMNEKSALNLLFYSSERIYRYSGQIYYSSFLNAKNDIRSLRKFLSRSPECIEPFLVGNCGTTLGYEDDSQGTAILAELVPQNSEPVKAFMQGVLKYFEMHHEFGFGNVAPKQVMSILYRYVQLPTVKEAQLFTRIFHQDNFGSNNSYPIITQQQIDQVEKIELSRFHQEFCNNPRVKTRQIHWPQAVITLIEEKFLIKQQGLMSMDIDSDVLGLVEQIIKSGWQSFSIYGAGEFFEKLIPYIQKNSLEVIDVIDRKVEISGAFKVAGFDVISLESAFLKGCEKIVISSQAFKDEIAKNIYEQSISHGYHKIEVLSL